MRPILLLIFVLSIHVSILAQDIWTIEDCIDHTLNNNIDLALQDINHDYAELGVKQAKHDFGPNINGSYSYTNFFGRALDIASNSFNDQSQSVLINNGYSLNGSLSLFNGMQRLNTLKKNNLLIESSTVNRKIVEENIQLQLLSTFLTILMSKEQLGQANKQKEQTEQERNRTSDLITDGLLAPNDIYLLDAQLANDEVAITTFSNNINIGLADLRLIMRLDPNKEIDIETPELPEIESISSALESVESIYNSALTHRSEIKSAELNEAVNEYDLKIAKGKYYPTLSLFGGANTNYSNAKIPMTNVTGVTLMPFNIETETTFSSPNKYFTQFADNLAYNLGLSLSIPIFNKNLTRLNIQQVQITGKQNVLLTEKAKLDLYSAVIRAHNNAKAAIENYNSALVSEQVAKRSLDNTLAKLEDGLGTNVEFNVASNNYAIASSRLIEAKYSYIFNIKYLDFYKGVPITF